MTAHLSDNGDQSDDQSGPHSNSATSDRMVQQVDDIVLAPSDDSEWWHDPTAEPSNENASDLTPESEAAPFDATKPPTASNKIVDGGIAQELETSAEQLDAEPSPDSVQQSNPNGLEPTVDSATHEQLANLAAAFTDMQAEVSRTIGDLTKSLKEKQRQDDLFNQMHEELQTHRQGIRRALMTPAMLDLVQLYDYFETAADHAEESSQIKKNYDLASQKLLETLMRNGVEPHSDSTNTNVDRRRHQVIGIEETSNPELDKKIARSTSRGFVLDGISLRAANVITWKFVPGQEEESEPDQTDMLDSSMVEE